MPKALLRAVVGAGAVGGVALLGVLGLYLLPAGIAVPLGSPVLRLLSDAPPLPAEIAAAPERSVITDAEGAEIATLFGAENRVVLEADEIAPAAKDAVVATEDARFYEHPGVDHRAVMRALIANRLAGRIVEGGSTITQQYVRNALLSPEQTFQRKLTEAHYAIELERRMSKDEILIAYLNEAYLGRGAYGIGAAAELYFSRPARDLELHHAATLAGMLRAPETNNPVSDPDAALARRAIVLDQMAARGFASEEEAAAAQEAPLDLELSPPSAPEHPFFVAYVTRLLLSDERLGATEAERGRQLYGGGLEIRTTLDSDLQERADAAIRATLADPTADPQATVTSVDPATGDVRALAVGPREFGQCDPDEAGEVPADCDRTEVNPAVPGLGGSGRQPGSAFKPFVVAAALAEGMPRGWQDTSDSGEPIGGCEEGYAPRNYGDADHGVIAMPEAMRHSSNVYHVKLTAQVGPEATIAAAARAGMTDSHLPETCSLALGAGSVYPLQLTAAFATLAAEGTACETRAVLEVRRDGEVLIAEDEPRCDAEALDPDSAREISAMLRGVVTDGTGTRAQVEGVPVAGKTGTTDDNRDAWFVGYTGGQAALATGVWIGYEQPRALTGIGGEDTVTGGSLPADVFAATMTGAAGDELPAPPAERMVTVPDLLDEPIEDVVNPDLTVVSATPTEASADAPEQGEPTGATRREIIGHYDLHVVVTEVHHWEPAGTVLAQTLDAGSDVPAGTLLEVDVSDGAGAPPELPDLIGLHVDEARERLEDFVFDLDVEIELVDVAVVVEPVDPEDALDDVDIGAIDDVDELGDRVRVVEEPEMPAGHVVGQSPDPGTRVEEGDLVTLEVVRHVIEVRQPDPDPDDDEDDNGDDEDDGDGEDENGNGDGEDDD